MPEASQSSEGFVLLEWTPEGRPPKRRSRHVVPEEQNCRLTNHGGRTAVRGMLQHVSAEIIYCHERARQAREKADAAVTADARSTYLAAESGWLGLARSYELQQRLSRFVKAVATDKAAGPVVRMARERGCAFDPDVVAILGSAFRAVLADLGLSNNEDAAALRAAQRILDLAAQGERDPERLKSATLAWVTR